MNLNLANKVFIVTGGAKGIGAGICKAIAAEQGIVVIAGRNAKDNQAMVDEIVAAGGKADSVAAELAHADACKTVIDFTIQKFGRIDGLVNNAGAKVYELVAEEPEPLL
jgi:L-fucose dehydrogenase